MELFRDADIVQYYGRFAPAVCEAAKASGVPVIIELMRIMESGQVFDYIDLSVCVSETVKKAQLKNVNHLSCLATIIFPRFMDT